MNHVPDPVWFFEIIIDNIRDDRLYLLFCHAYGNLLT